MFFVPINNGKKEKNWEKKEERDIKFREERREKRKTKEQEQKRKTKIYQAMNQNPRHIQVEFQVMDVLDKLTKISNELRTKRNVFLFLFSLCYLVFISFLIVFAFFFLFLFYFSLFLILKSSGKKEKTKKVFLSSKWKNPYLIWPMDLEWILVVVYDQKQDRFFPFHNPFWKN